jgi:hypothetical protein
MKDFSEGNFGKVGEVAPGAKSQGKKKPAWRSGLKGRQMEQLINGICDISINEQIIKKSYRSSGKNGSSKRARTISDISAVVFFCRRAQTFVFEVLE